MRCDLPQHSLRFDAARIQEGLMNNEFRRYQSLGSIAKAALLSASYVAIAVATSTELRAQAVAQAPAAQTGASQLPPVQIDEPKRKPARRKPQASATPGTTAVRRRETARTAPPPAAPSLSPWANTQNARTGTVGIYANSTSVATKVNTPLLNIPQSVNVVTREFIKDQAFPNLTEVSRYVPGVQIHQGEGNRDELVIRGVDSSANFFVNGFRDDVQYYRDLYNAQSVEIIKGPSALTFGRGSGGGLVNRTLKEADGTRVYETTVQTGSWGDRRVTLDAGQAVNDKFAARLNLMYEGSDSFRDFVNMERYGINPTITWKPTDTTKVTLSYEYFHDDRVADRGNPSQGIVGGATNANPARPFAPNGDLTKFFGSPDQNQARATVQSVMGVIDHDFENGLTVKNSTRYATYDKFYQNIYPGSSVDPSQTSVSLSAYNNTTNRDNLFNQTDFIYNAYTGSLHHTVAFGAEFGQQTGIGYRNTGIFENNTNSTIVDPFNPTYFGTVKFIHQVNSDFSNGVTSQDSNSKYRLNTQSAYARDTIDVVPWLQLIGGVRFDRFDMSATDLNPDGVNRSRVDNMWSPQGAIIIKPVENLSWYYAYTKSALPASGDQFSSLNDGTLIIKPQEFENNEIGVKWNINPRLLYTAAVYQLDRENVPLADPQNTGFFLISGKNRIQGFETALTGYVTPDWQSSLGYAYTDARVMSKTSKTIQAGSRIQLVPYNQVSLWNKYQINSVWGASLGLIYLSDSFAASDDTVKLPGFFRVDAGIYATINQTWSVQLNVENLFDKGYWASADGNNNLAVGNPRTFRVSATAKF
jgi:catecholate siderophore receptor